jgi:hypothetical protein
MPSKPFLSATNFINYYSQTDRKIKLIDSVIVTTVALVRIKISTIRHLMRFIRISKIENDFVENAICSHPIELLVVCGPEDFAILPSCIKSVLQFSCNPISKIVVIVREQDVEIVKKQIVETNTFGKVTISIINENDFIPLKVRSKLEQKFQKRYGWVLQQLIKVSYVSESQAKAVLVMDADTVLLQPFKGLDDSGNQHLSYSSEMQRSYRKFLKNIGVPVKRPHFSTVTHHMIIQPMIMRELLTTIGMQDLNKLTDRIALFNCKPRVSPVSIDYEMYGQYLRSRHSNKINFASFSNRPSVRSLEALQEVEEILLGNTFSSFRSISFHRYL